MIVRASLGIAALAVILMSSVDADAATPTFRIRYEAAASFAGVFPPGADPSAGVPVSLADPYGLTEDDSLDVGGVVIASSKLRGSHWLLSLNDDTSGHLVSGHIWYDVDRNSIGATPMDKWGGFFCGQTMLHVPKGANVIVSVHSLSSGICYSEVPVNTGTTGTISLQRHR